MHVSDVGVDEWSLSKKKTKMHDEGRHLLNHTAES